MNHKDLVEGIAASMSERQEAINVPEETSNEDMNKLFEIEIPMVSGFVYKMDTRNYNWELMATPENKAGLKHNQEMVRGIVATLLTIDFSDPKPLTIANDALDDLFKGFGIDPRYDVFEGKMMAKGDYVLTYAKCVDALTLLHTAEMCIARYELSKERFNEISETIKDVANLNDITEMDNSLEGLLSEDRINYGGIPDDHDVSGLLDD